MKTKLKIKPRQRGKPSNASKIPMRSLLENTKFYQKTEAQRYQQQENCYCKNWWKQSAVNSQWKEVWWVHVHCLLKSRIGRLEWMSCEIQPADRAHSALIVPSVWQNTYTPCMHMGMGAASAQLRGRLNWPGVTVTPRVNIKRQTTLAAAAASWFPRWPLLIINQRRGRGTWKTIRTTAFQPIEPT
jgi:hypothetical protein